MNWRELNQRILECKESAEAITCLELLFSQTRDGKIAYELGNEFEKKGEFRDSLRWFETAEKLFPMEEWKRRAANAQHRVKQFAERATSIDYRKLARYIVDEFNRLVDSEYVQYFDDFEFDRNNIFRSDE